MAASLERGDNQTIESKIKFKIVRFVANSRWEIGDQKLGDPSEIDGLLRGLYLNRPADGREEDKHNPLCFLVPADQRRRYSATIELRAKKADCVYIPLGGEAGGDAWERRNKEEIERLLALKMIEEANRLDNLDPP